MNPNDFMIDDFGLSAAELEEKYERKGAHPIVRWDDWRRAVRDHQTEVGYWEFVRHKAQEDERELDNDNPYNNTWMGDL